MERILFKLMVGMIAFGISPLVTAATIYVAPTGNDQGDGHDLHKPFATLQHAVRQANPGDTIEVRGGTYVGGFVVSRPGTKDAWITLKPYKNEKVTVEAGSKEFALYFYHDDFAPLYWTVQNIAFRGGDYVVKIDTPFIKLINGDFSGARGDIIKIVGTAHDVVLRGNEIHDNAAKPGANAQGVDIVGAKDLVIENNHVHDIPSIGMYAKGSARNVVFAHNRLENIYERGIMLGQSTDKELIDPKTPYESYDSAIRNNVIKNTGSACLATASSYNVKIEDNVCIDVATRAHGAIFISNESELHQAGTNIQIRHNVIVGSAATSRPIVYIGNDALTNPKALVLDDNRYWVAGGAPVKFVWERGSDAIWGANIDKWRRLTGFDRNSTVGEPKPSIAATAVTKVKD